MNKINSDHRVISERLDLYFFDSEMQGLPFLLPNWNIIKNSIQNVIREEWIKNGFNEVTTPILAHKKIYEKSGHLDYYRDYIFPELKVNDEEIYYLRPMTCPHHCIVYNKVVKSYRDLPFRVSENSLLHRYEPSGSLRGLERIRCMELVDQHIFVDFDRLNEELKRAYYFSVNLLKKFDFFIDRVVCAVHDKDNKKYINSIDLWEKSENILFNVLSEIGVNYFIEKDEAAFYGPKIDLEVKSKIDDKFLTITTIQVDFHLPSKFDLDFINNKGEKEKIIVIHHGLIGTYQRFISLLLERNSILPFFICPIQLAILPLNNGDENLMKYSKFLNNFFLDNGIRSIIFSKKSFKYRIRNIYTSKIPFYVSIGKRELEKKVIRMNDCRNNKIFENLKMEDILLFLLKEKK